MGETLTTWAPACNGSIRVEMSGQRTTSDSGALLLREALDTSGVIAALEDHLVDQRDTSARPSLAGLSPPHRGAAAGHGLKMFC